MIDVACELRVYEVDGVDVPAGKTVRVRIEGHWNMDRMVVLKVGDRSVTVLGHDLTTAVANATRR